jgi:hypothetical protein
MKAVIYLLLDNNEENYIEDIQRQINHDVKQFMITNVVNPHKSIYNKIENIFYFKDYTNCLIKVPFILSYLEIFNYTDVLLLNTNKTYTTDELIYKNILCVKNEFSIIHNIL